MTLNPKHVLSPDPWSRRIVPAWPVFALVPFCAAALLTTASLGGCQKTLIKQNDTRTQFDRYDAQRNQRAEQWIVDEFGSRRPNLRGRLTPKSD